MRDSAQGQFRGSVMLKISGLCLGTLLIILWSIARLDQLAMFANDWFSPLFVFLGGTLMTLSVNTQLDNLLIRRLEAFKWGSGLFAIVGVLIGSVSILGSLNEPKKLGPAIALALLTLFWAAVFNYLCKLIIENERAN